MPSYYKYQNPSEIGAAPTLDWGTVVNNVNETLQKQEQQRYENREADKKLANDMLTEINSITQSSDPNLGAIVQKTAYDAKANIFNRLKLVQSNKDSRSNFKIFKQNTSASLSGLDNFVKGWEPTYKNMVDLRAKGLTTELSNAAQDQFGGYQNFKDKKLIHNGNDGFLYTVEIDPETNKPKEGAFGILPFETLNNIKNYTDLKVNLTEKAAGFTDKIKPFITVDMNGKIKTKEGISQEKNSEYSKFIDNAFNSIAVNDNVVADILTNYSDYKADVVKYKTSSEKDRVVAGKIVGGNLVADVTPGMREEAKKIFERQLLSQVKYEETPRTEFAPARPVAAKTGTPPKYTPEVSDISVLNDPKTKAYRGVSIDVSGVVIPVSKGIEERIDTVSYDTYGKGKPKLRMKLTKVAGTETDEITTGSEDVGGTVKVGEGKKDIKESTRFIDTDKFAAQFSLRIKQVPYPGKDRNFRSMKEAEDFFKNQYTQQGGGNKASSSNKTISQSDFDAKWLKLKKGQTLVGPDGNTYTKG